MPDVHFRHSRKLEIPKPKRFQRMLAPQIALAMDCMDDDGQMQEHDPKTQIYFPVFENHSGICPVLVTIDIIAYDWANRLLGMDQKLECVTDWVRDALELGPYTVTAQFIPIPVGCWAKS